MQMMKGCQNLICQGNLKGIVFKNHRLGLTAAKMIISSCHIFNTLFAQIFDIID